MTIDEIIAKETELAQEFQEVIDTHMISDNFSLEEIYCDDTEVIEEHLQRDKELLDYHNTIADTLRKYQTIEQIIKDCDAEIIPKDYDWWYIDKIRKVLEDD